MKSVVNPMETLVRLGAYVLAVDDDGVIRWVSKRVEAFFREDVTGTPLDQLYVELDRPLIRLALRRSDGIVVPLRGDWVSWGVDADRVFVGSPAPESTAEMASIGLTLDDYPEHDSWLNYLVKSDEATTTQVDAAERIEQLKCQYDEAARMRDQMRDARKASLNVMIDLDRSMKRSEKSRLDLATTQEKLMVASRQAGMAEIATGVLHNVGNVLNSVNVSAALVSEKLRRSKVANVSKIAVLISEHSDDLANFIAKDEKGKQLPGFLAMLADHLVNEQIETIEEIKLLTENIEHIKAIVSMQQSYAGMSGLVEQVRVAEVLDDVLRMHTSSSERHEIKVQRNYQEIPLVILQKHKLLQILVNLIRNAGDALVANDRQDRRLTVWMGVGEGDRLRIEVVDNGLGIPKENLTQIFAHGFTTKKNGHGFGLHGSALAAKEMGGSLTASSDGPGKGATFTLELPLEYAMGNA